MLRTLPSFSHCDTRDRSTRARDMTARTLAGTEAAGSPKMRCISAVHGKSHEIKKQAESASPSLVIGCGPRLLQSKPSATVIEGLFRLTPSAFFSCACCLHSGFLLSFAESLATARRRLVSALSPADAACPQPLRAVTRCSQAAACCKWGWWRSQHAPPPAPSPPAFTNPAQLVSASQCTH